MAAGLRDALHDEVAQQLRRRDQRAGRAQRLSAGVDRNEIVAPLMRGEIRGGAVHQLNVQTVRFAWFVMPGNQAVIEQEFWKRCSPGRPIAESRARRLPRPLAQVLCSTRRHVQ